MSFISVTNGRDSYVRSSTWNLLRLEGEIILDGEACDMNSGYLSCVNETNGYIADHHTIKKSDFYEITVSGFMETVRMI